MQANKSKDEDLVLSKMNPKLIHRVLLTDESQFSSLTMSGKRTRVTPSYDDFGQTLQSGTQDVASTMKRAYRDHICNFVLSTRSMEPLHKLLLELYTMLRSLVPNRKDLHGTLKDEPVAHTTSPSDILLLVIGAAEALEQLESEVRSETTREWIVRARNYDPSVDADESIAFTVTSIMYLCFKTELCDDDKKDFYLANVWAPMIHSKGREYEKKAFESRFGSFSDASVPLTREWIQALVNAQSSENKQKLRVLSEARGALVRVGWVEDILFRSADKSSMAIPEILSLDDVTIQGIREVTRVAAAGSALALHACIVAGISADVLNTLFKQSSPLDMRREFLVEAMANRGASRQDDYEESVTNAVIALAKEWNPSLNESARDAIQSRTRGVLRGEDPVVKLLDSRMKDAFRVLVLWKPQNVPTAMRSGIGSSITNKQNGNDISHLFKKEAMREFQKRGLSFYASDLSATSWLAIKVVSLALDIFGKDVLDRIIQQTLD